DTPIILVGTKADMKNEPSVKQKGIKPIEQSDAEALAKRIGAIKYLECSAKTRDGLKEVFDEAIMAALYPPTAAKTKKNCNIL
ncbi:cell division control protein CDC42, partial [Acrasis kona]